MMWIKPNPYLVFDIDVFIRRSLLGRRSIRVGGLFVIKYMAEKYGTNVAVICENMKDRKFLEDFCEAYTFGIQRFVTDMEELYFMDRTGVFLGGIIHANRPFDPISTKLFFTYQRPSEVDDVLLTFQGVLI